MIYTIPEETIRHISAFGGSIWYVNKGTGSNANSGISPDAAFETIGAAIAAMATGDAITIKAGTYVETGLDLSKNACEMWFEAGAIIDPPTGTALIISGNYCKVWNPGHSVSITPAASQTGLIISGNFCYVSDIRVNAASSANIGFDITGGGCVLLNCRCASPLTAAFKVQGDKAKLEDCCTGGEVANASIGFWITNSCDKTRLRECSSQGHSTAGYQIDAGCTNGLVKDCASGGGDGKWIDVDRTAVWSDLTYDKLIYKTTTFAGVATEYNIFKVTGSVRVGDISGHVETIIENVASTIHLELFSSNASIDITDAPGVNIQAAVVGAQLVRNGPSTEALGAGNPNSTPAVIENTAWKDPKTEIDLVEDDSQDTYIRIVLSAALASGAIHWHAVWTPLTGNGFLEPA